ncbi:hypothetical protein GOODEAATRI_007771 [Goodea atripinnis]|uniref:Uncharacterized protein n=1 Tax=Goodea atripinnis TaxID=208336 RepID=A0ABV0PLX2_9TELE
MLPSAGDCGFFVQPVLAPAHSAKSTTTCFKEHHGITGLDQPENVLVKRRMRDTGGDLHCFLPSYCSFQAALSGSNNGGQKKCPHSPRHIKNEPPFCIPAILNRAH